MPTKTPDVKDLVSQARDLAAALKSPGTSRAAREAELCQVLKALRAENAALPPELAALSTRYCRDQDEDDDFFDNMPV